MKHLQFKALVLCGAATSVIPTSAWAQSNMQDTATSAVAAQSSTEVGSADIIVTAMRVSTSLQKTPIAVTAVSANELKARNVTNLGDLSNFVPSLSIGVRGGAGAAGGAISIRGMGIDSFDAAASVGTYLDDVYYASSRGNILGLMDVERIEVLRGPQGTLFGRNTIAGAIQYVTRQADQTLGAYLTGTVANFDRHDLQGAVNIPITDKLAIRVAGLYNYRDGYVRDLFTGQNRGSSETYAARAKIHWTPTDQLTVDLKGEYIKQYSNGRAMLVDQVNPNGQFPGLALLFGEFRPLDNSYISPGTRPGHYAAIGFNSPEYFKSHDYVLQGTVSYELSDAFTLKSITADAKYHNLSAQDYDNTPLNILQSLWRYDTDVFTQELQLNGSVFEDALKFTVGGYYFDSTQISKQEVGIGLMPLSTPFGIPKLVNRAKALYGQGTYSLTDQLSVSLGLRYSKEEIKSSLIGLTAPIVQKFNNLSPHFGVNFQATPDVLIYAKASRGFRAGGFTANSALPAGGNSFGPETAWTYEFGTRLQLFDRRLRFNPTAFYTDWKAIQFNKIVPTPTGTAIATENAGNAGIFGIELETQFAVTDRLQLTGSASYLDAKYKKVGNLTYDIYPFGYLASFPNPVTGAILPGSTVTLPSLTKNTKLQRAPKYKFSVGARYSYPLADDAKVIGSVDYSWTARQRSAVLINSSVDMPSYGVLNGRIQLDLPGGKMSLAVFGNNITNEYYLIGGADFAGGYTTGTREIDVARPREYGLEATVRF